MKGYMLHCPIVGALQRMDGAREKRRSAPI